MVNASDCQYGTFRVFLGGVLLLLVGCSKPESGVDMKAVPCELMQYVCAPPLKSLRGWHVYPPPNMINIPYDISISWRGRWNVVDEQQWQWLWNGKTVGTGRQGWENICARLRREPKYSKVFLCPGRPVVRGSISPSDPVWGWPWQRLDFLELVSERELVIIYSIRDEEGKVHPLLEEAYREWLKEQEDRRSGPLP